MPTYGYLGVQPFLNNFSRIGEKVTLENLNILFCLLFFIYYHEIVVVLKNDVLNF
jgi:hypothetical protein